MKSRWTAGQFPSDSLAKIAPILLRREADRLTFLLGMGISARLIELDEDKATPRRQEARQWLAATRSQQIKALADAWRSSQSWRDLWHIDGLTPDDSGWAYDAAAARQSLLDLLQATSARERLGLAQRANRLHQSHAARLPATRTATTIAGTSATTMASSCAGAIAGMPSRARSSSMSSASPCTGWDWLTPAMTCCV